jgi:hypothetical protein
MRVLDASLAQELVSLRERGYLSPFHSLLEFFKGFGRDQLLTTAFVHPAFEQLLETTLPVAGKPPLALAPTVAQGVGSLCQVGWSIPPTSGALASSRVGTGGCSDGAFRASPTHEGLPQLPADRVSLAFAHYATNKPEGY